METELCHGTGSWYNLRENLYMTFEYQLQHPMINDALEIVRLKIAEDPLPISTQIDWTTQIENARECYNFTIDKDDDPRNINIPEYEGSRVVAGPILMSRNC